MSEQISCLPILHLQQIRNQTIRRTRMQEIALGHFEFFRFVAAIFVDKVLQEAGFGVFLDLVKGDGI